MAEDRSGIYVISIVAVVAVVGLVTLFLRGGEAPGMQGELVQEIDEEGNVVGQAYYLSRSLRGTKAISPVSAKTYFPIKGMPVKLQEPAPGCVDSDGGDLRFGTTKGFVDFGGVRYLDSCTSDGKAVLEQFCFEKERGEATVYCASGACVDGACTPVDLI